MEKNLLFLLILDLRVPYRHNTSVTYIEHMIRQ
jgi:hypothetical protein